MFTFVGQKIEVFGSWKGKMVFLPFSGVIVGFGLVSRVNELN